MMLWIVGVLLVDFGNNRLLVILLLIVPTLQHDFYQLLDCRYQGCRGWHLGDGTAGTEHQLPFGRKRSGGVVLAADLG